MEFEKWLSLEVPGASIILMAPMKNLRGVYHNPSIFKHKVTAFLICIEVAGRQSTCL